MAVARLAGMVNGMLDHLDLTIVYEDGGEGWIMARIPEVPGTFSQGRTREEARENVLDALQLMLSSHEGDRQADPVNAEPLKLLIAR